MNTSSVMLHRGRISRSTTALLVLGALLTFMAASPQTAFGAAYVVDTTADDPGVTLTTCGGAGGDCSLRGAMTNAAGSGGADTITFDTSVFPPMYLGFTYATLITLGSALPDLSNASDTIDAGNAGVDILGSSGFDCFTISGSLNAIRGFEGIRGCANGIGVTGTGNVIGGTNVAESICGTDTTDDDSDGLVNDGCPASLASETSSQCWNSVDDDGDTLVNDGCLAGGAGSYIRNNSLTGSGVRINGEGADGNQVTGNLISANSTGITIDGGADSNQAGTSLAGTGNLIVGNTYDGVYIAGSSTTGNTVKGSYIGSGNDTGVRIDAGATGNTVGGTTAGERNIISGNDNWGVGITGSASTGNVVAGNYIGTDVTGTVADPNVTGVALGAPSNTVGGSAAAANVISGNPYAGVEIFGSDGSGNVVASNYIGTNADGTTVIANGTGVTVMNAAGNTIGGTTASARNIISGNTLDGILITGTGADTNTVSGNYIGTNAADAATVANGGSGITITAGALSNVIGGSSAGARNVISGNTASGVQINGAQEISAQCTDIYDADGDGFINDGCPQVGATPESGGQCSNDTDDDAVDDDGVINDGCPMVGETASNLVKGNYIGTNAAGMGAIANGFSGVGLDSSGNTVGGSTAGAGNVISGNGSAGVYMEGPGTTDNAVKGNYIGTNAAGTGAIPNTNPGVVISAGASSNTIGGTSAAERNVISGNVSAGVYLDDDASDGNVIQGNYIGTTASGASALANAYGIELFNGDNNVIGGVTASTGNLIAYNTNDGVWLESIGSVALGNSVRGNSIHSNGALGINIGGPGVLTNDSGDGDSGTNDLMNFPASLSASYNGTTTTVSGSLDTGTGTAMVDVYANDVGDGSGNGEGRIFVGSVSVATGGGPVGWALTVAGAPQYGIFTATATDSSGSGNTSEFSAYLNTDIDGDGRLSSVDNCDFADNYLQMDHDADGVGDACDSAVRNRFTAATTASIVTEFTTAPGQEFPGAHQLLYAWDVQPGSSIAIGSIVGEMDIAADVAVPANSPCTTQLVLLAAKLINASTDSSPANLVDTSGVLLDLNTNGIPDGAEKFPKFLTTLLDPERRSNVDEDNDGLVDEDPEGGVNEDADGLLDEDGTGSPVALHARYFSASAIGFIQVLVLEVTPDQLYQFLIVVNDPVTPPPGATESCAPLEFRHKTQDTSSDNPATTAVEGGQTVLNTPSPGTKVFRTQTADPADADADGIGNYLDKCPVTYDPAQADFDSDWIGDACDPAPTVFNADHDGDTVLNSVDNCPTVPNGTQRDAEVRTPLPFGSPIRDNIGDACDPDPTVVNDVDLVGLNDYSDPICVTGGGVVDSDGDGWCAANDPNDTVLTGAARTPEGLAPGGITVPGSCANGVDDDLDLALDSADSDCADTDGDGVPDNLDICDEAADPLQLDSDTSTPAGDACEANNIVTFHPVTTAPGANSELRERLVEVAPKALHRSDGIFTLTDPDWTIAAGSTVADGAIRAALTGTYVTSIAPDPTCNKTYSFQFTLIDASTNTASTISPGTNFSNLVADSDADGIPNGAEQFPAFLANVALASARLNNDADFAFDEDGPDFIDNDGDGSVDEDPYDPATPLARLFGYSTSPAGANSVMNVLIYSPGALPGVPVTDGYTSIFIINDPALNLSPLSGICSPLDASFYQYGSTLDNPRTTPPAVENGTALLTNPSPGSTERFFTNITTQPDADGDLIENSLDTCSLVADNDADTLPDQSDPSPWNPRLVSPPGDTIDRDGMPAGCDPNPTVPGFRFGPGIVGSCPNVATDSDCDGVNNTADNCSTMANTDQTDSDADGLGNICDSDRWRPTGTQTVNSQGTPACIGDTDDDKDGFCLSFEGASNDGSTDDVPEASAYLGVRGFVCTNNVDDDHDELTDGKDLTDSGCGDADQDLIINEDDNCPLTDNGPNDPSNQVDHDADSTAHANAQPWQRSAADSTIITGPVSTVIGEPFQRSDNWGGDACDPDDDNDLLPDPYDPCPYNADCDNDGLEDWWEYQWPGCLNVQVAEDREANPDGDAVFTYGEATVTITSPCVANMETSFNGDEDGDGTKSGPERWLRTGRLNRCEQGAPYGPGPSGAWGADLAGDDDRINVLDLSTYVGTPRRLNTKLLDSAFDRRWDVTPGPSAPGGAWVDVLDIQTLFQIQPSMPPYLGNRAFQATGPGGTPLTCTD